MITVDLTNVSGNIFCLASEVKDSVERMTGSSVEPNFYSYMDCPDYVHAILHLLKYVNIKYKDKVYTYMQGKELADKIASN